MKTNHIKLYAEQNITEATLNSIGIATQSIRIDGRTGKWSMIATLCGDTIPTGSDERLAIFGLFEHDTYGDMTEYSICFFDWYSGDNDWKEIDGTYDDIFTALRDFDVIE